MLFLSRLYYFYDDCNIRSSSLHDEMVMVFIAYNSSFTCDNGRCILQRCHPNRFATTLHTFRVLFRWMRKVEPFLSWKRMYVRMLISPAYYRCDTILQTFFCILHDMIFLYEDAAFIALTSPFSLYGRSNKVVFRYIS